MQWRVVQEADVLCGNGHRQGYRRLCSRMDKPKAVTAAAHKLARLICTMLTKDEKYTDQGQAYCEERYWERVLRHLQQRANNMGMQTVLAETAA